VVNVGGDLILVGLFIDLLIACHSLAGLRPVTKILMQKGIKQIKLTAKN